MAYPTQIRMADDSGILMTGFNYFTNAGELLKLDLNGHVLWSADISGKSLVPLGVVQAKDGGYWIYGQTATYDDLNDGFFCKLDACAQFEYGYILRQPQQNSVEEMIPISETEIILKMGGSAFIYNGFEYTCFTIFNLNTRQFSKNYLFQAYAMSDLSTIKDSVYYTSSITYFADPDHPNDAYAGSSIGSFNSKLEFKNVKHLSHFDFDKALNLYPTLTSAAFIEENGDVLVGACKQHDGKASIFQFDRELNLKKIHDSKTDLYVLLWEQVEYVSKLNDTDYLLTINKISYNPSNNITKACFAVTDSSFKRKKEILYGDTINYIYRIWGQAEMFDKGKLVAMSEQSKTNGMNYCLVKFNQAMEIDSTPMPDKAYDYGCHANLFARNHIFDEDFDTTVISSQYQKVYFSELPQMKISGISIYPNPGSGTIYIRNFKLSDYTLEIFDEHGKLILQQLVSDSEFTHKIELPESIGNGIYFVKIKCGEEEQYEKLILIR